MINLLYSNQPLGKVASNILHNFFKLVKVVQNIIKDKAIYIIRVILKMALIKDYFEKTNKYINEYGQKTVVLMQVGAFFEVYGFKNETNSSIYGSSILDFSKICDLHIVDKKVCVGSTPVMMAGFKDMFLEKYVKKLQDAGFTSVVFTQDEQAPNTTRSLSGIFSPGTYFSCDTEIINNNSCCIWFNVVDVKTTIMKKTLQPFQGKPVIYVGIAIIDIYTGKSNIFEFKEAYIKNPTTFDELERIISIYHPSETILIGNINRQDMDDIINYTNISSNSIHYISLVTNGETNDTNKPNNTNKINQVMNCEKQTYQKELFKRFFQINDYDIFIQPFYENIIGSQAFCYLLDFIYQHNPYLVNKIKEPVFENVGDKLILANHSLKQLNIIDDHNYKGRYSSVCRFLNICITSMGKRKFNDCFLNPTTKEDYLKKEYDIIGYCLEQKMNLYETLKSYLFCVTDISKIQRQMIIQKIAPKNLYQLYTTLQNVKSIYHLLEDDSFIGIYLNDKIPDIENICLYIEEIISFLDSHVDINKCKNIDNFHKMENNFIQNGVNIELDKQIKILSSSEDILETCRNYFHNLISQYETNTKSKTKASNKRKSVKTVIKPTKTINFDEDVNEDEDENVKTTEYVKIHETEKNNFGLVATERRCKILEEILSKNKTKVSIQYKSSLDGNNEMFELDTSPNVIQFTKQSGTSKFITSYQIAEFCRNVSTIKSGLMEMISKVYLQIIEKLAAFQKNFDVIGEYVTYIDFIFAKAFIAQKYGYCKPTICSDLTVKKSFVKVKDLRHCLIEHLQQNELYVANDISLGLSVTNNDANGTNGILLYGTNAVGKTSFIRSLGIAVIMAQAGLYVPASSFEFKPYKYIFTRILGNDNLFKGLSTFAVEMSELRTILRLANENSLVLGDELCSGTESISAMSIFVAGIQKLYHLGASFIFATHLHEITHYEEIRVLTRMSICHMTVIYDKENDMLVYDRKLRDGPGDNMYGLEVCKSLNLPGDFLEAANNIRMKYHPQSSSILDYKKSSYNAKHIKGVCENCGDKFSNEVHHLQYQQDANDTGIIQTNSLLFHKNHPANLLNLCETCHQSFHKTNEKYKKVKTTKGQKIISINS
jgi:DNA mismatch repair protein MutS